MATSAREGGDGLSYSLVVLCHQVIREGRGGEGRSRINNDTCSRHITVSLKFYTETYIIT